MDEHSARRCSEGSVELLAMKRMRRRAGLFLAVFGVVLLLSALSVGLSGYLAAAATVGARAGLAELSGADGGFRVTMPLSSQSAAQDARVRATVRDVVRVDGHAVAVVVTRTVETIDAAEVIAPGGDPLRVGLASIPGLPGRAVLVVGEWPTTAAEASIQADAAARVGLHVGDRVGLPGGASVTITATWRARDVADPRWLGDRTVLTGLGDNGVPGWIVIDPSHWPAVTGGPPTTRADAFARWTVQPDSPRVTIGQLAALQGASDAVQNDLLRDQRNGIDVQQSGGLQIAIQPIAQNVQSAAAAATAPLVVVAVLGLVMLIELARMLEQLRLEENALLRARGAGRGRFAWATGTEAAVAAVPGAALGALVAVGLLAVRGVGGEVPVFGWAGAGVVALVAVAALAAGAGHSSRDVSRGSPMRGAGARAGLGALNGVRLRSTVEIGAVLLLVLAAVVAVSQFVLYGSALAPTASGGVSIDPLAVAAPALAIAAIGLLALAGFPLLARLLERGSRWAPDLRALPLRQLARRSRPALTPILVVAFAVSGLVVAASYSGTWEHSIRETRAAQIGTDVRVVSPGGVGAVITRPVDGERDAAPATTTEVQIGDSVVTLVELPGAKLGTVISPLGGVVDPAVLARQLRSPADRPAVPVAATAISVRFTAIPELATPSYVELTVVDAAGAQSVLRTEPDAPASVGAVPTSFTAALPTGVAPWTVHAIDVLLPATTAGATVAVSLSARSGATGSASGTSLGEIPLDSSWAPSRLSDESQTVVALADGRVGVRTTTGGDGVRILLQSVTGGQARLPVVISQGVAENTGLSVGAVADMALVTGGGQLPITVVGVSPVIPGVATGDGVLVDLASIQDAAMRDGLHPISASEWWVSTADPASAASALRGRAPLGTVVETQASPAADQVLQSARVAVWVAGAATALLALLAVAAGLVAELRGRRDEVDVLRALGVAPDAQSRGRATEWSALLLLGVLVGLLDGFLVSAVLVPGLARMAVPSAIGALRTTFQLDLPGALLGLAVLLLALLGLIALIVVTVRRQARVPAGATITIGRG